MFKAFFPKEREGENRVALLPGNVKGWQDLSIQVCVESGLGTPLGLADSEYADAGAEIVESGNRGDALGDADVVCQVGPRPPEEVSLLKKESVHIGFLDPFRKTDLVRSFVEQGSGLISMEMMPRTTLAQKMDALSSQANLAGYSAVLLAANKLDRIFPMMMTPAGTLPPARVFVVGVGVAGLQAIATAKRLGARVDAFDTRPVVEDQVKSLGAKFVKIDLGETGEAAQGYAKELTPEQIEKQQQGMAKICSQSDVVITTAQVFGRQAPRILSRAMIEGMKRGSVVVDMAVSTGGNVEGSEPDKEVSIGGATVLGPTRLPGEVAFHASQMFANNIFHLVEHFKKKEEDTLQLDLEDELLQGCLLTHGGQVISQRVAELIKGEK